VNINKYYNNHNHNTNIIMPIYEQYVIFEKYCKNGSICKIKKMCQPENSGKEIMNNIYYILLDMLF